MEMTKFTFINDRMNFAYFVINIQKIRNVFFIK